MSKDWKGWKSWAATSKAAKALKRKARRGAVEPAIVHSFDVIDGIDRAGGAVKIEPSQKSTPKSSPAPIKTTEPSIVIAAKAGTSRTFFLDPQRSLERWLIGTDRKFLNHEILVAIEDDLQK
jgi:hypothetical protein